MIYRLQNPSIKSCFRLYVSKILVRLYLAVSQQIVCLRLSLGSLISRLPPSPDHSDTPQPRFLQTPGQLSVDKTKKGRVNVCCNSAVLYKHFLIFSPKRGPTRFCKLSSCSLYHLSFSSRLFFSSSSFFTKSISLEINKDMSLALAFCSYTH